MNTVHLQHGWWYTTDWDKALGGYCTTSVYNCDDLVWSRRFDTISDAEIAAREYIHGFTDAHDMGAPAAVGYILASGIWPGAEIIVDPKRYVVLEQRPGEWFTTFLIRAARDIARNLQDRHGMRKFTEEYNRCCEATK